MKLFENVQLTATKPKTQESQKVAYMYAILLVVFGVAQLFTFEKFITLVQDFMLPFGSWSAQPVASLIVTSEVLALPFLLNMKLSKLMRAISMVFGWMVPALWFKIALWVTLTSSSVMNIGFLGGLVRLVPGWWAVFFAISLGLLAAWASWGMWPFVSKTKQLS